MSTQEYGPAITDSADVGGSDLRALRESLIRTWAAGISRAVFIPMSPAELNTFITGLVDSLIAAAAAGPDAAKQASMVGARLVGADLVAPEVVPATSTALWRDLTDLVVACGVENPTETAAALQAAVLDGYVVAERRRVLREQESIRRAEGEARALVQEALRSSEAMFRAVFAESAMGIGIGDMTGRIVDANHAFASMLGYTIEEFCRLQVQDFVYADDAAGMWEMYAEIIEGRRETAQAQKRYRHRDGHLVWTDLRVSLVRDQSGAPLYTVAMVEDVTDRRQMQEELRHSALHDPLTQLPNRTLFQDRLEAAFTRRDARVGLCYLDLDHFKTVNDSIGHDVGDALLIEVAKRIGQAAEGRLAARMGGDEFVILVEDPDTEEMARVAQMTLAALSEPFQVAGHELSVSASIGVVEQSVAQTSPAELLKSADTTMYWAKTDGRGRWVTFDAERSALAQTRYTLATTLLPGLAADEFTVHYQPIVDVRSGKALGMEALVRWKHPSLGRLQPVEFIEVAEENGAIVALGQRVLEESCLQVATWNEEHPGSELFVSVNLAVRQAQEADLVDRVRHALTTSWLPPHLLQLELTESALLGPDGPAVEAIRSLADLGVRIALDDFGTGYSNLAYLPRLPLHTVKLASALWDPPAQAATPSLLKGVVELAHALGLHVTAEGIETGWQRAAVAQHGCDTAQGWYFGRAAAWPEATRELQPR